MLYVVITRNIWEKIPKKILHVCRCTGFLTFPLFHFRANSLFLRVHYLHVLFTKRNIDLFFLQVKIWIFFPCGRRKYGLPNYVYRTMRSVWHFVYALKKNCSARYKKKLFGYVFVSEYVTLSFHQGIAIAPY